MDRGGVVHGHRAMGRPTVDDCRPDTWIDTVAAVPTHGLRTMPSYGPSCRPESWPAATRGTVAADYNQIRLNRWNRPGKSGFV